MRIGELAQQAGVSIKAVRYYEQLGLIRPERLSNGYRDYSDHDVRAVKEIRSLAGVGISPARAAPFVDCLTAGHRHGDECPASLAVYSAGIAELDRTIASLFSRREQLAQRLQLGASRTFRPELGPMTHNSMILPDNLPIPEDDGAAAHLPGRAVPPLTFSATDGRDVHLAALGAGRSIIYFYPLTGAPETDLPEGWESIPGARGCTTEACDFRDHHSMLLDAGANRVFGLSSQEPDYQRELVKRLGLPFAMFSDTKFILAEALTLPTFTAAGHKRLYTRLTLVINDGIIEHVFYPIFPPNTHAQQVLEWLRGHTGH